MADFLLPGNSHRLPERTGGPGQGPGWRPGSVLPALVVSGEPPRLRVAGSELPIRTPNPPQPGDRLLVEVLRGGNRPELRVLERQAGPAPSGAPPATAGATGSGAPPPGTARPGAELAANLMRDALPRQQGLSPLLATLRAVEALPPSPGNQNLQQALAPLVAAMRGVGEISRADGVQRAVAESGLFTENRLLGLPGRPGSESAGAGRDLKTALNRSLQGIRAAAGSGRLPAPASGTGPGGGTAPPPGGHWSPQAPSPPPGGDLLRELPELLRIIVRQIEGSLARTELHQAASLHEDDSGRQHFWLEIPVRRQDGDDVWQFRFERGRRRDADGQHPWRVVLSVNLPELGPLHAELSWRGGRMSTRLLAEEAATVERIRGELGVFRKRLQDAGVPLQELVVQAGAPQHPGVHPSGDSLRSRA